MGSRFVPLAFALLAPSVAVAYPISPATLWELAQRADHIVLARVESVEKVEKPSGERYEFDSGAIAHLVVEETLKGAKEERIDVSFSPNLVCPAPPHYAVGKQVLAFLNVGEKGFKTTSLSYGTRYPQPEEIEDYRDSIASALAMQAAGSVSSADRRAWLVEAASHRATRWDGLYELIPEADEVHSFYDRKGRTSSALSITASEASAIANGFVAEPDTDRTLAMTLSLLAGYRERAFDRAALRAANTVLQEDPLPYWADDLLPLALERIGAQVESIPKRGWKREDIAASDVQIRRLWREGIASTRTAIPDEVDVKRPVAPRVGGSTPD